MLQLCSRVVAQTRQNHTQMALIMKEALMQLPPTKMVP
jgi:hypothetical protein